MSLSAILYFAVLVLLCVKFYRYAVYKPKNFPPGPIRLPIWGSYSLSLMTNWNFPHFVFEKWAKKYGQVFGMYIGDFLCVVTNDYETCKEVFNRVEFDGKPDIVAARTRSIGYQQLGLFFTEGPFWHEQRRFSLRHMRDYGFGRRFEKLELLMSEQIHNIIEFMKYTKPNAADSDIIRKDGAINFPDILYPCQMNAIMSIFGMESADHNTERYRHFRHVGRYVLKLQHGFYGISTINVTPWIKYLLPKTSGYHNLIESNKVLFPFFKSVIEEIKNSKMDDEEVRCFYDMYFNRMKENEELGEVNTFSDDQLLMLTIDYMFPAVSAVPAVFVQVLYSLLNHLECQAKMQAEIDEVVGRGRLPTLDDRKDLPYTEAVIREVMRKETLVPIGILHRVIDDTKLRGYDIPKDTLLFTNLHGVHFDKKVWGDPENFRPERFINQIDGKLSKVDRSLPFGAGKRLCAGETFARNSVFLLVACLFQNFTFKMATDVKIPKMENKISGLINTQKDDCWVYASPRE